MPIRDGPRRLACPMTISPGLVAFQSAKSRAESLPRIRRHRYARPVFHAAEVLLAEFAVLRKRGKAEIPTAVIDLICGVICGEALNQLNHARDVFGGAGNDFGLFDAEEAEVFKKCLDEAGSVLADGDACGCGVPDDLVVHVGDVHDVAHLHAGQFEVSAQDVDLKEGTKVADMTVVIDCRSASVHTERLAVGGGKFVHLSR